MIGRRHVGGEIAEREEGGERVAVLPVRAGLAGFIREGRKEPGGGISMRMHGRAQRTPTGSERALVLLSCRGSPTSRSGWVRSADAAFIDPGGHGIRT
jgi:hypothetical protein